MKLLVMMFPCLSFIQTQMQNGRWLLGFQIPLAVCEGKHASRYKSKTFVFKFLLQCVRENMRVVIRVRPSFSNSSCSV